MLEAPIPDHDDQRLDALRSLGILDTPPEQRFNRITRTAARLFKVPIALISLVDETRQWFKSSYGLFVAETPRNVSFCGHAILSDDIFLVEDTHKDQRFRDNPLVTGPPHVRFYAGRPLATPSGAKLGTLCLIDREPRTFSDPDRLTLEDLAGWAEREINLSLEFARLHARMTAVLENVAEGAVLFGADGRIQWTNSRLKTLLGQASPELNGAGIESIVARESLEAVNKAIAAMQPGPEGSTASINAVMLNKDGRTVLMRMVLVASVVDGGRFVTAVINRM